MKYHCGLPCFLLLVACALTAEGRYVHGPGHLSDALDSSIEIERPCLTNFKSLISCSGIGADRLMPHPDDCHLFYQCAHMWPICRECPADLHFNPIKHICDRPENAGCANSSIDIESTISTSKTTSWPTNTTPNFTTTTGPTNTTSNSTEPQFTTPWPINTRPDFNITTEPNNTTSNSTEPQFTTPWPINTRPDFNITTEPTNTTSESTEPQFTTPWLINSTMWPEFNKTAIPTSTTPWTTTPWWTTSRLSSTTRD